MDRARTTTSPEQPNVPNSNSKVPEIIQKNESALLQEWVRLQLAGGQHRGDLIKESELRDQASRFLSLLGRALQNGGDGDIEGAVWADVREDLAALSRTRAKLGFSPSETAMFVFSIKEPLFARIRSELGKDGETVAREMGNITVVLDRLGLLTTEMYQKSREEVIARQQQELMELSTPVVTLWDGILALPLIGTLDSARTQVVMENLLQRIVETGAMIAILDITGVPTVDTLVAQHLLKAVAAARLMGADCIISGIRPQIAQTIVHLGVDLGNVTTKATLADAFKVALDRTGQSISRGTFTGGTGV
jgi:rsbT co-antagonist protein RsbR